jgi:hypothetical protein
MPIGIVIIMLNSTFTTAIELTNQISAYFDYIDGEHYQENKPVNREQQSLAGQKKIHMREPEPATIAGLALFLGFCSRQAFDDYEQSGEFAHILKRGRLHVEAVYEKKLHQQSSAGAIFALKSMGWNEKVEGNTAFKCLTIEIIESGPKPAENEKEVVL